MRSTLFLIATIICQAGFISPQQFTTPIRIDGVISEGEWDSAKEYELSGGGKVKLKQQQSILYVAIQANKKAWTHIYLSSGDTLAVLHASAALGRATYVKNGDRWHPVQSFEWALREKEYNDDLAAKQVLHYRQFGWVANNNNMNDDRVFEFQLDLSRWTKPLSFACVAIEVPMVPHYFPAGLKDDTILPKLLQGYTPDSLQFSMKEWWSI
jgi:hypothetical protein